MAYSEKVVDHYENPRNVGSFDKSDTDIGTGMVGAPACGDVMKLQIKVPKRQLLKIQRLLRNSRCHQSKSIVQSLLKTPSKPL